MVKKAAKKDSKTSRAKKTKSKAVTVAGVKVSKGGAGDLINNIVSSPLARELVADALIAIAGVIAGNKGARQAIGKAGTNAASSAGDLAQTATGAVAEVVTEAARRILPSSMGGETASEDKADEDKAGRAESAPADLAAAGADKRRKPRDKHPAH